MSEGKRSNLKELTREEANKQALMATTWRQLLRRELRAADLAIRKKAADKLWRGSPEAAEMKGATALALATRCAMADIIKPLVELGADPNIGKARFGAREDLNYDKTELPLHRAIGLKDEREQKEMIAALLSAGAKPESSESRLTGAVVAALRYGSSSALIALSELGVSVKGEACDRSRLINWMRWEEDATMARAIPTWVKLGGDVSSLADHGRTLLESALMAKSKLCVKALVEAGARVLGPRDSADTPLELAQKLGSLELTRLLLSLGESASEARLKGGSPLADEVDFALRRLDSEAAGEESQERGAAMCALLIEFGARLSDPAPERFGAGSTILDMARKIKPKGAKGRECFAVIQARAEADELSQALLSPKTSPSKRRGM